MPIITPDTTAVKEIQPIEPGVHPGKIVSCDFKTSAKGNPMIVPTVEVMADGVARKRNAYLVITGDGAYGFDSLLRACGFEDLADRLRAGSKEPFDTDELIGIEVNVQIGQEAYQGRMVDRIEGFLKM